MEKGNVPENQPPPPAYAPPPAGFNYSTNTGYVAPTGDQAGSFGYSAPPQYGYAPQQYGMQGMQQQSNVVVTQQPNMIYQQPQHVPDNQCLAIVALLFCWPIGIVALLRSNESRNALIRNDVHAAMTSASSARRLSMIAIVTGIILTVAIVVIAVVVNVVARTHYCYNAFGTRYIC